MPDQSNLDLAINTATTRRQWSLAQAIDGYARTGISAIGPWREEVREMGHERAARQIRDAGVKVTGLCRAGLLSALDEAQFRAALDDNRRAIDEAAAIGAKVVVLVAGGLPSSVVELTEVRRRVAEGIATLIPDAKAAGVQFGIEPLHPIYAADRCVINTLDQAVDLCDNLDPDGENGLGVIIDTYHVWWDPGLTEAVDRAASRALGYHINDWMSPQADPLNDRGMMGDGSIDLVGITRLIRSAGIALTPEVELFSDCWWAEDPDVVVGTGIERWRTITAQVAATE